MSDAMYDDVDLATFEPVGLIERLEHEIAEITSGSAVDLDLLEEAVAALKRYELALRWIVQVNACDYEYVAKAKAALTT